MILTDILIGNNFSKAKIRQILAIIFDLDISYVSVIDDIEDIASKGDFQIVCTKTNFNTGLPLLLTIYNFNNLTYSIPEVTKKLANKLDSCCYIPSDIENPFELIEISPSGNSNSVFYNVSMFEEYEVYILDE